MKRLAVLLAIAGLAGALGRPARACSFSGPAPYVIDASMQATDHVPPTLPPLSVASLQRGKANEGCSVNSCAGIASLAIAGAATDDVTPAAGIGYRFSLVDGALPMSFAILLDQPSRATVADGKIWFNWDDSTADHEPIDFTLQVVAIDEAGNESAPQTVLVSHDAGDGCAVAGGSARRRPLAWFAGLALAGALVARRGRPERIRGRQRGG
jgi:hypothetical protein